MGKVIAKIINSNEEIPSINQISAVFMIAFDGKNILAIKNERGWDIPGGHLNLGENLLTGLRREIKEESGAEFTKAIPYAVLTTEGVRKKMLFYTTRSFKLGHLDYSEDVLGRDVITKERLINLYYGDKKLLKFLLDEAEKIK